MKIYPNKSTIAVTKEVNPLTDIPLSYIDTNAVDYTINTIINENFKIKEKKEILPYDKINNFICLFDKNENQIPYDEIGKHFKREGKDYFYVPYGSYVFEPKKFEYTVTIKKNIKYSSNMPYNIKALVANNPILANQLMPIFGDAPSRLVAPANIIINNGDLSLYSITNGNMKTSDFTFMLFNSFNSILEYDHIEKSFISSEFNAVQTIKDLTTNIVAVCKEDFAEPEIVDEPTGEVRIIDENKVKFILSKEETSYKIKNPILYDEVEFETNKYFTVPKSLNNVVYHNIFDNNEKTPILIEEHVGKGFIIYMTEEIVEQAIKNNKIIYEALAKVYFNTYLKTDIIEEWISDKVPDFIVSNKKLVKKDKFISNMELYKMFGLNQDEVVPYEVNIDKSLYPFVEFTGLYKSYLSFEKNIDGDNKKYSDPKQPDNTISIYTSNQNIMYFEDFMYSINDSVEDCIKVDRVNDEIRVSLKPFRHSSSGIYIKNPESPIIIPLIKVINDKEEQTQNADFYLIVKENESVSDFNIINSTEYEKSMGNILATIQIRQNTSKKVIYDMRQRGGGLPIGEEDNFDCFDIGHIIGRPYRKSGTLIITLPKYLEPHKEIIEQTIKQYSVAEDYPIIIFKED